MMMVKTECRRFFIYFVSSLLSGLQSSSASAASTQHSTQSQSQQQQHDWNAHYASRMQLSATEIELQRHQHQSPHHQSYRYQQSLPYCNAPPQPIQFASNVTMAAPVYASAPSWQPMQPPTQGFAHTIYVNVGSGIVYSQNPFATSYNY